MKWVYPPNIGYLKILIPLKDETIHTRTLISLIFLCASPLNEEIENIRK